MPSVLAGNPFAKPKAHAASYLVAWEQVPAQITYYAGRYYAQWQCDVGGTIVAAAAWWIWLSPGATALGMLAGISWTVGCHMGYDDSHYYQSGVPFVTQPCIIVYPHGSYARRFEECIV